MNKGLLLPLLILLFLGLGAYYFVSKGQPKTSLIEEDWKIAVEDKDDIYRVFIANREGKTVDIKRTEDGWIYNDKWVARPNAVDNILNTISGVDLRERPGKAAIPHIVNGIASQGVKVEVFGKNDKVLKKYYVGGMTPDERGTYMIMDGSDNPYIMHLPYWDGNLRSRYFLEDKNWRDKTVFAFDKDEIKSLRFDYPQKRSSSFSISRKGEAWDVEPIYKATRKKTTPVDQDAVEEYLTLYTNLVAESIENSFEKRDSVTAITPFCIINIEKINGEKKHVNIHPLDYTFPEPGQTKQYEKYLADIKNDDKDLFLIQHLVFSKIFWSYEYFFEKKKVKG